MMNPMERMEWMKTLCSAEERIKVEAEKELAEFMEDVNRVVQCTASVRVQNKTLETLSEGIALRIQGSCCFSVVYRSSVRSGEGGYASGEFSADFDYVASHTVGEEFDPDYLLDLTELSVDAVVCRPLGPRKLQLRCELTVESCIKGNYLAEGWEPFAGEGLQIRPFPWRASVIRGKVLKEITVSHELTLSEDYPPVERLLDREVKLFFDQPQVNSRGISFQSTAMVSCCYLPDGEDGASPVSFVLPLEATQFLECDSRGGGYALVQGYPTDLRVEAQENDLGERRKLRVTVSYLAEGVVCEYADVECIADCYSTRENLKASYREFLTEEVKHCASCEALTEFDLALKDDEVVRVEMIRAALLVDSGNAENQGIRVQGRMKMTMLGIKSDGSAVPIKEEKEVSFLFRPETTAELLKNNSALHMELSADVKETDCTINGEQLVFRATAYARILLVERHEKQRVMTAQSLGALEIGNEGRILFYYPEKDEEPWEIGKRFHIPMETVQHEIEREGGKMPEMMMLIP